MMMFVTSGAIEVVFVTGTDHDLVIGSACDGVSRATAGCQSSPLPANRKFVPFVARYSKEPRCVSVISKCDKTVLSLILLYGPRFH